MHDDLKSFKQKPAQKFHKNSKILKTPKFIKNPKSKVKSHEMHDKNRESKIKPDEELISRLKNFWVRGLE